MPATEQTWRNQKTMHVVFGVSALVMAVATVWMMAADHNREWKDWQLKDRKKDAWMTQARHDALAQQYAGRMQKYQQEIRELDLQPIDPALIEQFKELVIAPRTPATPSGKRDAPGKSGSPPLTKTAAVEPPAASNDDDRFDNLDEAIKEHEEKIAALAKLLSEGGEQAKAVDAEELRETQDEVIDRRRGVLAELDKFIREARRVENSLVTEKKSKKGERTAKVSELGIKIGEGADADAIKETQDRINELDVQLADLTAGIADARTRRMDLEAVVGAIEADKAAVAKELDSLKTELVRLEEQVYQNTSNVGEWVTRWPILNALYSGNVRIEQNWLPDLTINYNFAQAARFDRCATCHRGIAKTAPGTATDPLYPTVPEAERERTVQLATPEAQPAKGATIREVYGLQLTDEQAIEYADPTVRNITVLYVLPETPAARAGIQSGDVIRSIDGTPIRSVKAAEEYLLTLVDWASSVPVALYRGLDHPFTAHPRLDLYLSDMSPHPQKDVGCTICHDGQGSGTEFAYTSHTPDNATEQNRWAREYGWFDNHHWIFPMKPGRFVESNCLKCHHEKGGLQPSERFPEPPAAKLVEGWSLVEEYGCFGCHEINGYNSPEVTVGPDVRLEPNYYEAAAQMLRQEGLSEEQRKLAQRLHERPESADVRHELFESLRRAAAAPQEGEGAGADEASDARQSAELGKLANLLKDVETPGEYRKVGPSLRHLASKVEYDWLYSWIRKPSDFRPSTRMPQFFLQYEHLSEKDDDAELAESQKFEPIEIRALAEYLLNGTDDFEYLPRAEGITEEPSAERGKWVFQSRGCLACHSHAEFPEIKADQGPDLSRLQGKLDTPKGRDWLYSWVKEPQRYHVRTKMPDVFLDPIAEKDPQGKPTGAVTDPAADVMAFLLGVKIDWHPQDVPSRTEMSTEEKKALADLALEWLASDAIPRPRAEEYLLGDGIPEKLAPKLKADEQLLVGLNDDNRVERQLKFVARRTIGKYGCFGCHDIPGFEDAKPIGTALADWGRKETSKLAFENIHKFLETHGIDPKNPKREAAGEPRDKLVGVSGATEPSVHTHADESAHAPGTHGGHLDSAKFSPEDSYFIQSLNSHGRDGFLWQKLRFPRSYDYKTTHNKSYNERLRMPRFPFNDKQREAVMTFVLGLVKEPPAARYLYKPMARDQAIADGRKVLDRFNCAGCHTLKMEQWEFDYATETFGEPTEIVDFPFLAPRFSEKEIAESEAKDYRGMLHASLHGQPVLNDETGEPFLVDEDRQPITKEELIEAEAEEGETIPVFHLYTLWRNALLDGGPRYRGIDEMLIPADREQGGPANGARYPAFGGDLVRYLFPKVVGRAREINAALNSKEAWGWLPPPLMDEGWKVQPDWLHGFLMDPHAIRPAVVMRMPNFHMSSDEAAKLVDYFAASSGAEYPYEYKRERRASYLTSLREKREDPLGDAMKIVASGNYCVKCHAVADFAPQGDPNTFGPNLADVYGRLRPEFTRDWIANPVRILPYTGMPVNLPYRADDPHLGGVNQELFEGTSIEQLQGVVDLLMNFDAYARSNTSVTPLVEAAAEAARQEAAAAAEGAPADGEDAAAADPPQETDEEPAQ